MWSSTLRPALLTPTLSPSKLVQKEVEEILAPLIGILGVAGSLIPGVGAAVGAAAAFGAAGLDFANQNTEVGIAFQPDDCWVHAINGEQPVCKPFTRHSDRAGVAAKA